VTGTVIVYRDRIVPRSEAHFLRRLYINFTRLDPVWVGRRTDEGLSDLQVQPVLLGRDGSWGAIDRALFKHFGRMPPRPDLRILQPRIIHAHFGRGGALALPIARNLGIPLVVTFHGGDATKEEHYRPHLFPTVFQRRLEVLQREAALFVCVSDFIRQRLTARGFPVGKLCVIRNGTEIDEETPVRRSPAAKYFLFAGRFVEKKGVGDLIEAMRLLEAQKEEAKLILLGDGPMAASLKRQAQALARVEFVGWVPNREVRSRMRDAIAVCVPSTATSGGDAEGLPSAVIEAMAVGTPVIATYHAGIGEAVDHGRTGLLVASGDPPALARALQSLLDAPEKARIMGENARQAAAEHFNADVQSRVLEDALLRVIAAVP
jgi:colanic acid/amylovoran biosynthesis glycosyltransferase